MTYRPAWMADLQPATWRGLPFVVEAIRSTSGRQTAVHLYPMRDLPWVEDLGLGPQEFTVYGYLWGDDVSQQYADFGYACHQPGHGEFVHPRLGSMTVSLTTSSFVEAVREGGNVVKMTLVFLVTQTESSITLWPVSQVNTASGIVSAAADGRLASVGSFLSTVGDAVRSGQAAVKSVATEAMGYVGDAKALVSDASRAVNSVAGVGKMLGIPGLDFSRYLSPLNKVTSTLTSVQSSVSTVNRVNNASITLLANAGKAQASVVSAADRVTGWVNKL
ncbi:DNA circularization N-terminal domain-containing protein [Roseicella sp. DB1501]|uniref:DNA circularization N-terminal domain-containing protein n=1 Tax=Roseicella sp. DB1501 TaxID=2730925 RepID=UPI001492901B|nr:DNA circularization N-terminal domain-containing protein [Roseicella sp. DB1501]NOG69816.1 DNA circularization N-terminal domain-containing protein [Roseicella sp. DB1501]